MNVQQKKKRVIKLLAGHGHKSWISPVSGAVCAIEGWAKRDMVTEEVTFGSNAVVVPDQVMGWLGY
tara:strand:- start:138 stop:335 length:198 start_codon:yes stop_codon:yes gene_type:complete